jgi:hypothetical protein
MDIQTFLRQRIEAWGQIGHPALMERFIDRNGTVFQPRPFAGLRMMPTLCFQNCMDLLFMQAGRGLLYAEGYGWRQDFPLLIHHAWLVTPDGKVVDPTWVHPETYQYIGISLPRDEAWAVVEEADHYSVLDPGMINLDWMFGRDPGLRDFLPEPRSA